MLLHDKDSKLFRDNVHGYVKIPVDIVRLFIDTDIFQRLRFIEQTGMRTLYPSARHDRFIHSLGVYHLGVKAFSSFEKNISKYGEGTLIFNAISDKNFWGKCEVSFALACLLHDCGHAPFSHSFEFLYEYSKEPSLNEQLKSMLSDDFKADFNEAGSPHERMSALVVCSLFEKQIQRLFSRWELVSENVNEDLEFITRMIIGCKYKKYTIKNQIKNCLISLLNSDTIDVDSLDYIVRDAKLSGVDNMSVDTERLLGGLTIIEKTTFENAEFEHKHFSANILEGTLKPKESERNASLNGKYHGESVCQKKYSIVARGYISISGRSSITKNSASYSEEECIEFSNVSILKCGSSERASKMPVSKDYQDLDICASVEEQIKLEGSERLVFNEDFHGEVEIDTEEMTFKSSHIEAEINGCFSGEMLGKHDAGKLALEIGYHQSALSVIENVLIARNYEYKWIYSHHKVVYYANYLIIELYKQCIDFLTGSRRDACFEMFSWQNMIDKKYKLRNNYFFRPVDLDILFLFKQCAASRKKKGFEELKRLLSEFQTRIYRQSLWKSYAEFRIFMNFSEDDVQKLYRMLVSKGNPTGSNYGSFPDDWQEKFREFGMLNVVWVRADSKMKALNPDRTYIKMRGDEIRTYRSVASQNIKTARQSFFYIYYDKIPSIELDKRTIRDFISGKINPVASVQD